MTSLMSRCITDLMAGGHLASHCYVAQSYSVMRPVHDSLDLAELFASDPSAAELWITTERGHRDFNPADVRERLGRDRHDPVHGHFSEAGSHPRFRGARSSAALRVATDDPENQTAFIRIGPTWEAHPDSLFVWMFGFNTIISLALGARHVASCTTVTPNDWFEACQAALPHAARGIRLAYQELGEPIPDDLYTDLPGDLQDALRTPTDG